MVKSNNKNHLGKLIEAIRVSLNKNKKEFAEMFDTNGSLVSKWEKGTVKPSAERLTKIAELGNTTVEYLLYGSLEDYARGLLNELEKELKEDDSITEEVAASIISDIEGRLFPEFFPPNYKDRESLEKDFNEYKKSAMKLWKNYKRIDLEIASRIRSRISSDINNNKGYFYVTTYDKDGKKGEKVSTRADKIVKRLENLDRFQREYIDTFRFLDDEKVVKELDKIDSYTDKLRNLNGTIDITNL
jgi:putative transcriptional regulator